MVVFLCPELMEEESGYGGSDMALDLLDSEEGHEIQESHTGASAVEEFEGASQEKVLSF